MADEPENLTLKQLAALRADMQEGFALLSNKIGVLAEGMVSIRKRLDDIDGRLDRIDQKFEGLRNDMHMVTVAVDQHTVRLDRIEPFPPKVTQ